MKIEVNSFANRQIGEAIVKGPFGGFSGSAKELIEIVGKYSDKISGKICALKLHENDVDERFLCTHTNISPEDQVYIKMEARREGELPVPVKTVKRAVKEKAVSSTIILYSKEALGDEATTDADYEIVSINNTLTTEDGEPMDPSTILRNWFAKDEKDPRGVGGTHRDDDAEKVIEQLYNSIQYWATKARCEVI